MKKAVITTINDIRTHFRELVTLSLPMLCYGVIYLFWWTKLERGPRPHYSVIYSPIDDMIPFAEIFIVPYLLWFFYCLVTLLYFLFRRERDSYLRVLGFLGCGMTLFLIISTLFPNILHLRPQTFARDNVFTGLVSWLYTNDTSTNVFPSIHVFNAIGCHLAISRFSRFSSRIKTFSFVLCVSIILSTMFLKQHSVYDVLGAMALCIVCDALFYRAPSAKLVDLPDELVSADGDETSAFAGQVHKISHSGESHL